MTLFEREEGAMSGSSVARCQRRIFRSRVFLPFRRMTIDSRFSLHAFSSAVFAGCWLASRDMLFCFKISQFPAWISGSTGSEIISVEPVATHREYNQHTEKQIDCQPLRVPHCQQGPYLPYHGHIYERALSPGWKSSSFAYR